MASRCPFLRRVTLTALLLALTAGLRFAPFARPVFAASPVTLRVIPNAGLRILDPVFTGAYVTRNHGYLVYDTLFAMDERFQIHPQMVDAYSVSADRLTYRFTLRPGLKWHDGSPVTSRDCIASIRRWGARDPLGQKLLAATQDLAAAGDSTFVLRLKTPFGLVLEALGKPSSLVPFMMPERIAATDPAKPFEEVIGSGPFRFVKEEFQPGVRAVYVKNPDYRPRSEPASFLAGGKLAEVDRVEWTYVPDYNTAIAAVAAGEFDMLENVPPELTATVAGNPRVKVVRGAEGQLVLRINHRQPPFDNVKVRRALFYLVDQDEYLRATVGDPAWAKPCWALFGCGGPYDTSAGVPSRKPDLALAKRLLAEGGYRNEPVAILDATDFYTAHNPALVTAQHLRQAGVNVVVQAMDWNTLIARTPSQKPATEGGWSLFHTFYANVEQMLPAANQILNGGCDKAPNGWYCDPRMEELRDQWARAADPKRRRELAIAIQERAYDQVPYIPLGEIFQARVISARLHGVKGPIPVFWGLTLE